LTTNGFRPTFINPFIDYDESQSESLTKGRTICLVIIVVNAFVKGMLMKTVPHLGNGCRLLNKVVHCVYFAFIRL